MKTVTIKISGMHCAACSNGVERSLKKVTGVDRAEVKSGDSIGVGAL